MIGLVERLRHPDLIHVPTVLRRALVAGGYTTREAIAAASDEALLALPGVDRAALWRLRSRLYDAHRDRSGRRSYCQAWRRASRQGPRLIPQARGELAPSGVLSWRSK